MEAAGLVTDHRASKSSIRSPCHVGLGHSADNPNEIGIVLTFRNFLLPTQWHLADHSSDQESITPRTNSLLKATEFTRPSHGGGRIGLSPTESKHSQLTESTRPFRQLLVRLDCSLDGLFVSVLQIRRKLAYGLLDYSIESSRKGPRS